MNNGQPGFKMVIGDRVICENVPDSVLRDLERIDDRVLNMAQCSLAIERHSGAFAEISVKIILRGYIDGALG